MMKTELKMDRISNILMIDLEVWSKPAERFRNMMVVFDTGATMTTISKDILFQLGYNVEDGTKSRITTASGVAYVNEVILDKLKVGSIILDNVKVYAHTFPEESFATGVLGLNVISKFNTQLDFSNSRFIFEEYGTE